MNPISKISIFWVNIIGRLGGDFNEAEEEAKPARSLTPPNHSHIHQLVAATQQETYPLDMAHLSMQRPPNDLMRKTSQAPNCEI